MMSIKLYGTSRVRSFSGGNGRPSYGFLCVTNSQLSTNSSYTKRKFSPYRSESESLIATESVGAPFVGPDPVLYQDTPQSLALVDIWSKPVPGLPTDRSSLSIIHYLYKRSYYSVLSFPFLLLIDGKWSFLSDLQIRRNSSSTVKG